MTGQVWPAAKSDAEAGRSLKRHASTNIKSLTHMMFLPESLPISSRKARLEKADEHV